VEATVRYAAGLGYEVTMVKDATADYSAEEMHAALDINLPNYASAMVTTNDIIMARDLRATSRVVMTLLVAAAVLGWLILAR
jgi:nicotinamidase-related amidase